jgi:hypothetical protein
MLAAPMFAAGRVGVREKDGDFWNTASIRRLGANREQLRHFDTLDKRFGCSTR